MIAVADTSPLNYLIRLGYVDFLQTAFGRVAVPLAVLTEMLHPDAPQEVRAWALTPPSWIVPVNVQNLDSTLPQELGIGEREAISLAMQPRADILLIDGWAGRQAAGVRNIAVAGTLAILLNAAIQGHRELRDTLNRLIGLGFRVSPRSIAAILSRFESSQKTN